jgi:fructokinase
MRTVAVIGNLSKDTIDGGAPTVGGAPYHAARALRLLGGSSRVVARCAVADRRPLVSPLAALGVPWTWVPAERTASFDLAYDGEERELTIFDPGSPWALEDARAVGRAEWLHLGALTRDDFPPAVLAFLARDRRLALDGQALARPAADRDADLELLRHVTVLKLSAAELAALGGEDAVTAFGVPEVVITNGSADAVLLAGGKRETITVRPVDTDDPTGAGDAFLAAYVWARASGHRPSSAARHAATTAARVLELAAAPAA